MRCRQKHKQEMSFDPGAPNNLRGDTVEDHFGTKVLCLFSLESSSWLLSLPTAGFLCRMVHREVDSPDVLRPGR